MGDGLEKVIQLREVTSIDFSEDKTLYFKDGKWVCHSSYYDRPVGMERDSASDFISHSSSETEVEQGSEYEGAVREKLKPIAEQLGLDISQVPFEDLNVKAMVKKVGNYIGEVYGIGGDCSVLLRG